MNTRHAEVRARQCGIPLIVDQLLDLYGQGEHDGRGAVVLYLSKRGIRAMEHDLCLLPIARVAEWFDICKVKPVVGITITVGNRIRLLWRK